MNEFSPRRLLCAIFLLAGIMFLTGISWGLPSRRFDSILFGQHPIWTGQEILNLAGNWDESADRGADVAMHPLIQRQAPIVVNETDAQRAQILRRYRLYSEQPDEMITFRSLSSMKPSRGDFDPRLYQYGGLWIYPVGALLKIAGKAGLLTINSNIAFYLDHPDEFARFYIVARLYSVAWGLIGVAVVYALAKEWTGKQFVALFSAALYAVMPVVVNMAHEAKPHLPGAVLTLAAILAAMRFARTGRARHWIITGILCGAALGMVLSGAVAFAVLPVMTLLRPIRWGHRIRITAAAAVIGLGVFVLTNPYLPINLLFHRSVVQSNLGNSGHFYQPKLTVAGIENAMRLLAEGLSLPATIAGLIAVIVLSLRRGDGQSRRGWLLAFPAILMAGQFVLLAHDQPAEYGRFAVTLDIILAVATANAIALAQRRRAVVAFLVLLWMTGAGLRYVVNFLVDDSGIGNRYVAFHVLNGLKESTSVLVIWTEPAPFSLPPVDLFKWKIVLLPRRTDAGQFQLGEPWVSVRPVDQPLSGLNDPVWTYAPISWANKPFEIIFR
jgi:hypothetical protein